MKLLIERGAWQKIQAYVDNCPYEIGGLGKVTCVDGDFLVTDAEIFTQKVNAAHVEMTAETLALFQTEKVRAKQSMRDYKFWWHSHAKMAVFFSGTDTDTINQSGAEFPWLVSFVTNHKHEKVARLDIYQPVHVHCDLPIEIVDNEEDAATRAELQRLLSQLDAVNPTIMAACKADIDAKVTMPGYKWSGGTGGFFGKDDERVTTKTSFKKLSRKEKKRMKELETELKKKERVLRHLEGIEKPTATQRAMIENTEDEISVLSHELDTLQGVSPSTLSPERENELQKLLIEKQAALRKEQTMPDGAYHDYNLERLENEINKIVEELQDGMQDDDVEELPVPTPLPLPHRSLLD